ncbi:Band 4.1-like protein 5 [Varanus komodoensis]|nr:Band 4.1-like protein 5 [Varanus komodoensis]
MDYLDQFQSGFRPGYGTESALVALYDDLCKERDRGSASLLVLPDLSVAFNIIDHGILLDRLARLGVGSSAWWWFRPYLASRFQKVVLGDNSSAPWQLCHGVPQGSIWSPMLFNIYMKPLGKVIRFWLRSHQYADDTQLYILFTTTPGEAVAVLNRCLAEVMGWMRASKLSLSPDKMEVLFVGGSRFQVNDFDLVLDKVAFPLKDRVCSLGVLLDLELSLETQVAVVRMQLMEQPKQALPSNVVEDTSLKLKQLEAELNSVLVPESNININVNKQEEVVKLTEKCLNNAVESPMSASLRLPPDIKSNILKAQAEAVHKVTREDSMSSNKNTNVQDAAARAVLPSGRVQNSSLRAHSPMFQEPREGLKETPVSNAFILNEFNEDTAASSLEDSLSPPNLASVEEAAVVKNPQEDVEILLTSQTDNLIDFSEAMPRVSSPSTVMPRWLVPSGLVSNGPLGNDVSLALQGVRGSTEAMSVLAGSPPPLYSPDTMPSSSLVVLMVDNSPMYLQCVFHVKEHRCNDLDWKFLLLLKMLQQDQSVYLPLNSELDKSHLLSIFSELLEKRFLELTHAQTMVKKKCLAFL